MPAFNEAAHGPISIQRFARVGQGTKRDWFPAGDPCATLGEALEGVRAMGLRGLDGRDGRSTAARVVDCQGLRVGADLTRPLFHRALGLPVDTADCDPEELELAARDACGGSAVRVTELACPRGARALVTPAGRTVGYLLADGGARIAKGFFPLPASARLEGTPALAGRDLDFTYVSDAGQECRVVARVDTAHDGSVRGLRSLGSWTVGGEPVSDVSRADVAFLVMVCEEHLLGAELTGVHVEVRAA